MRSMLMAKAQAWVWAGVAAMMSGVGLAAAPGPAAVRVLWSTYLRAGPGEASETVFELEHDTRVTLDGCQGRWCRVKQGGAAGWIDRDALELPRSPAPAAGRRDCVSVPQADEHGRSGTRFCGVAAPSGL